MTFSDKKHNKNTDAQTMTDKQVEDTLTLMKSEIEEANKSAQRAEKKHPSKHHHKK
jgi:hypothetical protein